MSYDDDPPEEHWYPGDADMLRMKQGQQLDQTCKIELQNGSILEVEMTQAFLDRVRMQFDMPSNTIVDHEHIKMFVYGAFKNAIDKAEGKP